MGKRYEQHSDMCGCSKCAISVTMGMTPPHLPWWMIQRSWIVGAVRCVGVIVLSTMTSMSMNDHRSIFNRRTRLYLS